jgi:hypothetical protein
VLEDAGGIALTELLRGSAFTMPQWVDLAAELARTLAGVRRPRTGHPSRGWHVAAQSLYAFDRMPADATHLLPQDVHIVH